MLCPAVIACVQYRLSHTHTCAACRFGSNLHASTPLLIGGACCPDVQLLWLFALAWLSDSSCFGTPGRASFTMSACRVRRVGNRVLRGACSNAWSAHGALADRTSSSGWWCGCDSEFPICQTPHVCMLQFWQRGKGRRAGRGSRECWCCRECWRCCRECCNSSTSTAAGREASWHSFASRPASTASTAAACRGREASWHSFARPASTASTASIASVADEG